MKKQALSSKLTKKIIAILMAFNLLIANTGMVGMELISYAIDTLNNQETKISNTDIQFNAFFKDNENETHYLISDVNEKKNMNIYLNVETGYLKNAKIELLSLEGKDNLNYQIDDNTDSQNIIQKIKGNKIELQQLDNQSTKLFEVPMGITIDSYMSPENITEDSKAKLTGTYVNNKGKEIEIEKEIMINVTWTMAYENIIDEKIVRYIPFNNGTQDKILLQKEITVETKAEGKNKLPVEQTKLSVEVPTYNGTSPETINVTAKSLGNTTGEEEGKVTFTQENWTYIKEENLIKINTQNKATSNGVYSGNGKDTYLITYVYNNILKENTTTGVEFNTSATVETELYNGQTSKKDVKHNFILTDNIGEIISYNSEITQEISKGKLYANLNQNVQYENKYNTKWKIDIASQEYIEALQVQDMGDNFLSDKEQYTLNTLYNNTKINKVNFEQILGAEGNIKILNTAGEELANINKQTKQDENANYVIEYASETNRIILEISKPIAIGNLVLEHEKEIQHTQGVTKQEIQNSNSIISSIIGQTKYANVAELVNSEQIEAKMHLKETSTQANLYIEPENLSTIVKNENVIFKIQLNDEKESSDLYVNPVFDIYLPNSVEQITVKETNILYNEEMKINKVEALQIEGNNIIRITLEGQSTKFSTGTIARGTNILLKADVTLKKLTPNKTETIEMYYTNENAIQYFDTKNESGYNSVNAELIAPTGLINISTITNFDDEGSSITSINQGEKVATIKILESAKYATMTLTLMNNNPNTCSDVTLIGKLPFKGNTDLKTGEELGTTIDTVLTSSINSLNIPAENITIYYSENANVEQNLSNPENGWTTTPIDLSKVKSYLIKLNNYELQPREIVEFTYNFQIPEKLEHNNYIFGTFGTIYKNNTELATIAELAIADKVGLTTGAGPELDFSLIADVENDSSIMQYQNIKYKMTVKNKGSNVAEDIVATFNIANGVKFSKVSNEEENYSLSETSKELFWIINTLKAGETKELEFELTAANVTEAAIETNATLTAKDLGSQLQSEIIKYTITESPFAISLTADYSEKYKLKEDISMNIYASVRNNTQDIQNNVVIKTYIPDGLIYVTGLKSQYNEQTREYEYVDLGATYDKNTRVLTYTMNKLEVMESVNFKIEVLTEYITGEDIQKEVTTKLSAQADGTQIVYSNELVNVIARAKLEISQTSSITNTYLKEGDSLKYIVNIANNGYMTANKIKIKINIPEELEIENITYKLLGVTTNVINEQKNVLEFNIGTLPAGEATEVIIITKAKKLGKGKTEASISNTVTVGAENIADKQTNTISHIIEINEDLIDDNPIDDNPTDDITVKTYKINGLAWLDENKNGARDSGEKLLSNIPVSLVNDNNQIISKINTNENGAYEFAKLNKGNYFVMFTYDTKVYKVTEYKKDGVKSNLNSDVFEAEIKQDNILTQIAITDAIKIESVSYSNIDLGLITTEHFNLSLNKSITAMILQNSGGTTTYNYDHSSLAKMEIAAKKLAGSTVIIEYEIAVTNTGTTPGTASNIVDYIPSSTNFSSELNPNWYLGQDNNIYNQSLKDVIINPGETQVLKLILTKKMTENNTGMVNNKAEIYEAYNEKGLKDVDSTPGNKVQGENDIDNADAMISVRTGEVSLYISLVFIIAAIIGLGLGITQKSLNKSQWNGLE